MIFTFYSFKGGVGRSMAMASIGELLFKRGLKVRIVDFDLEAPGLESYFDHPGATSSLREIQENRGVIDMLESYCQLTNLPSDGSEAKDDGDEDSRLERLLTEPLDRFLVPIYRADDGSYLTILPAGRRAGGEFNDYASRVLSFDWNTFFGRLDGELFFEWFRREIVKDADVVLVDSRTGVTEMTGISTFHLADAVVSIVAPNHQNLEGLVQMAVRLSSEAVLKARHGRPVLQMFVPSRVSLDDETQLNSFKVKYEKELGPFFPSALEFSHETFHALKILHVATFSYKERVAGREPGSAIEADLVRAYNAIARQMARLAPPENALYASFHSVAEVKARTADELWRALPADQQKLFRQLATRLVRAGSDGERTVGRHVMMSRSDMSVLKDVIAAAVGREIVRTETTGEVVKVSWTEQRTPDHWTQLQEWIVTDHAFLVWRQALDERYATWQSDQRDANLLMGAPLATGVEALEQRRADLLPSEQSFIEKSVEAEQRRTAADPAAQVRELENSRLDLDSYITEQYTAATASTNRATISLAFMFGVLVAVWIGIIEPAVAHARAALRGAESATALQDARTTLETTLARLEKTTAPTRRLRSSIDWMKEGEAEYIQVPLAGFTLSAANGVALATGIGSFIAVALIMLLVGERWMLADTLRPAYERLTTTATSDGDPLLNKWMPRLERLTDSLGRPLLQPGHLLLAAVALAVVILILLRISFLAVILWSYSWPYKILLAWIALNAFGAIGGYVTYLFSEPSLRPSRQPEPTAP